MSMSEELSKLGELHQRGVESWVCRLLIAVLTLFGGFGVIVYLLLWIFVPSE